MKKVLSLFVFCATLAFAQNSYFDKILTQGPTTLLIFQLIAPPIIVQEFGPMHGPTLIGAISTSEPSTTRWVVTIAYADLGDSVSAPSVSTLTITVPRSTNLWSNFSAAIDKASIKSITIQEVSSVAAFVPGT